MGVNLKHRMRGAGTILALLLLPGLVFAETLEFVTYYPSAQGGAALIDFDRMHASRATVGDVYDRTAIPDQPEVLIPDGTLLVADQIGIGLDADDLRNQVIEVEAPLHIYQLPGGGRPAALFHYDSADIVNSPVVRLHKTINNGPVLDVGVGGALIFTVEDAANEVETIGSIVAGTYDVDDDEEASIMIFNVIDALDPLNDTVYIDGSGMVIGSATTPGGRRVGAQKLEVLGNVLSDSAGTSLFMSDRNADTNFNGLQLLTDGAINWTIGSRGSGTEDLHIFDDAVVESWLFIEQSTGFVGVGNTGSNAALSVTSVSSGNVGGMGTIISGIGSGGVIGNNLAVDSAGDYYTPHTSSAGYSGITFRGSDVAFHANSDSVTAGTGTGASLGGNPEAAQLLVTKDVVQVSDTTGSNEVLSVIQPGTASHAATFLRATTNGQGPRGRFLKFRGTPTAGMLTGDELGHLDWDFHNTAARQNITGTSIQSVVTSNVVSSESVDMVISTMNFGVFDDRVTITSDGRLIISSDPGGIPANSHLLVVDGTAGKTSAGDTWANLSDARLKQNILPLQGALESLLTLRGVTYEWKDPSLHGGQTDVQMGLVAQEVEQVFPNWVSDDPQGYKWMAPIGFKALTIEAFRELKAENASLQSRNRIFQEEIRQLQERLDQLEQNR